MAPGGRRHDGRTALFRQIRHLLPFVPPGLRFQFVDFVDFDFLDRIVGVSPCHPFGPMVLDLKVEDSMAAPRTFLKYPTCFPAPPQVSYLL